MAAINAQPSNIVKRNRFLRIPYTRMLSIANEQISSSQKRGEPNPLVAGIHDRMPVMLKAGFWTQA